MAYRYAAWMGVLLGTSSVFAWPEVPLVPVPPLPLPLAPTAPLVSPANPAAPALNAPPMNEAGNKATLTVPEVPTTPPQRIDNPEQLLRLAREQMSRFDSYIVRLSRREALNGQMQPGEVMMFRFRARPWSVYLKWLGKEGKGREVVYVKGQHENKIHSLLSAGDIPFMPAGKRMALSPDNILVRNACRHPLEQAGLAASVERIGRLLANTQDDPKRHGTLKLVGPVARDEFEKPVWGLEHTMPPGLDPTLERGGKRTYFFHPETHLPMLITAFDERGNEAEYYFYDRLQRAVKLDDHDFDPDHLWGKPAESTTTASR